MKSQQSLPRAAGFGDFFEVQFDRRLDARVGILLQTIARFHEARGRAVDGGMWQRRRVATCSQADQNQQQTETLAAL